MKAGLAKPIFRCRMLIELGVVGAVGLFDLKGLKGIVVVEENSISVVNEYGGRTD